MRILVLAFWIIVIAACDNLTKPTLSGNLTSGKGKKIIAEKLLPNAVSSIGEVICDEDGNFSFNFEVNEPGFYRLKISDQNFLNLILHPEENVSIQAEANNLAYSYSVKGSPSSERLAKLNKYFYTLYAKNDSLTRAIREHYSQRRVTEYGLAVDTQKKLADERSNFIKNFVDEQPGSLASLAAINSLNIDTDFEYFDKVASGLSEIMPSSEYYTSLKSKVDGLRKFAVGATAPEIVLPNPNGEIISLSSLKGNVVLLDFWASWCKPCRRENPNVVSAYQQYKDQGFTVYSVSLDGLPQQPNGKASWISAIQQDKLEWNNHVSDLQGWNSPVAKNYNITGIPYSILLDREGKIIGKNLRGTALLNQLQAIFGS